MQATPVAYATTIVNYVNIQSVSGGQEIVNGQDGADGQNGKNGADGQRGEDGQNGSAGQSVFLPTGNQVVSVKSTVNGVTVFESTETNQANPVEKKTTVLVATSTLLTDNKNTVSIQLSGEAHTEAAAEVADSRHEQIQEVISIIQQLLVSYVSKLF